MPTLLSDPPRSVYLVLLLGAVVAGAVAFRRQDRRSFAAFGVASSVLLLVWLLDLLFESPREEAVRRVNAMAAAVTAQKPDDFVAQVSDSFDSNGRRKADLKAAVWWGLFKSEGVEAQTWDFSRDDVEYPDANSVRVGFMAKGKSRDGAFAMYYMQALVVKDPDGQYRVKMIQPYDPVRRTDLKVDIPNFP